MKKILLALALLAGCGGADPANNASAPAEPGGSGPAAGPAGSAPPSSSAALTGLYQGGDPKRPNQLCMIEGANGRARFGLVIWGPEMRNCSGSGEAVRTPAGVSLRMAGDETCAIAAKVEGDRITLPDAVPAGCAYYCGSGARLTGTAFDREGSTAADARKARDLAGDPLCVEDSSG